MKKITIKVLIITLTILLLISAGEPLKGKAAVSPKLYVHFIDVGQSDCILIQTPDKKNMLIDAGNNDDYKAISQYIDNKKVKKLDVIVATHPHEDHIGSLDSIIDNYAIGKIYMPKVSTTTKTFSDVLQAIKRKGLKVTNATAGVKIDIDPKVKIEMIAPSSTVYDDLNNYSVVVKITYGTTSILLTGDAEDVSEKEMLSKKFNVKADLIKIGHHGSSYSTTAAFLKAVSPKYAVISVGKDNDYGHPSSSTLSRLSASKVQVYRTDLSGTITASSDGKTITLNKSTSIIKSQESSAMNATVYVTKTGTKYHVDGCRFLKSKIAIKLSDAKNKYNPCSSCNPPK